MALPTDQSPTVADAEPGTTEELTEPAAPRRIAAVDPIGALMQPPTSRRSRGRLGFWLAAAWIGVVALAAVFADVLPLHDPNTFTDLGPRVSPGLGRMDELLGTDVIGRSVTARLVYGARQSLTIGVVAVSVAVVVGSTLGLVSGYFRGKLDEVINVVLDSVLAFPPLVLLLAVASIGQRSVTTLIAGLAVLGVAPFARLVRANTLSLADREFVLAARSMGASNLRIMFREILPNVIPSVVSIVVLFMATIIVAEGSLSFLGLGVPPPDPSWGSMVNEGRQYLRDSPLLVFIPSAALLFTVMSLRRLGEQVQTRVARTRSNT